MAGLNSIPKKPEQMALSRDEATIRCIWSDIPLDEHGNVGTDVACKQSSK
jgi:hypothetical protein